MLFSLFRSPLFITIPGKSLEVPQPASCKKRALHRVAAQRSFSSVGLGLESASRFLRLTCFSAAGNGCSFLVVRFDRFLGLATPGFPNRETFGPRFKSAPQEQKKKSVTPMNDVIFFLSGWADLIARETVWVRFLATPGFPNRETFGPRFKSAPQKQKKRVQLCRVTLAFFGLGRFELPTPGPPDQYAKPLRYSPIELSAQRR